MLPRVETGLVPFQQVKRELLHFSANLTEDKTIITYD